jgi:cytochrome b6-f complex iron-sulfur subunit
MRKLSRKSFLIVLNAGIVAFFIFLWKKQTDEEIGRTRQKDSQIPYNKNKKVSFSGDYILITEGGQLTVLSARCTHLGCRIKEFRNDKLICPCHGSEYDFTGSPLKGPAFRSLEKVNAEISADGKSIEIKEV